MAIKTEMHGTGGGRWTTREDAKQTSRKARRENDRRERCADCGEPGERTGHQECQYPQDRE